MSELDRFKNAQDRPGAGFESALSEIRAGGKRGHWIWYIFPQLAGLGRSPTAVAYAISGIEEGLAYLRDPVLLARLIEMTEAVARQLRTPNQRLDVVMGSSIDAQKLVSSLTLFGHLARRLHAERGLEAYRDLAVLTGEVLAAAAADGYPACRFTIGVCATAVPSGGPVRG